MPSAQPSHLRVLHLEDNASDALLTSRQLEDAWPSCDVVHVTSKIEFERVLQKHAFDVILSDFTLCGFDGMTALGIARRVQPSAPFIFLSGTIGEERAVEALKHGGTDYVLKDRPARLIPSIRRALRDATMHQSHQAAEAAIREAADRFNQLADVSGDIFLFANLDPLQVTYVSPSIERTWGLKPEALFADPAAWLESLHPDDRTRVGQAYHDWLANKRPGFSEEYRVLLPDRPTCWMHHTGAFGRDAAGNAVRMSWVARDVTAAKESAEQNLRAQRLDCIGMLAGGIAHDLNNALSPVLMSVGLLRPDVPPESQSLLTQIEVSARRGASMVRQLLAFARGSDLQRVPVDPWRPLQEVEQLVRATFPKSIAFVVSGPNRIGKVAIDPTQLYQVLVNLCVNARDAMPEGGTLSLELENCRIDESYAGAVPNAKPGDYVVCKVADTGVGIPPDLLQKIFDPFFTTKPAGTGTGLGLTTVAGIAHNHGGFVRIQSDVGKGSCFRVFLPAIATNSASPFPPQRSEIPFRGNGEMILLVDDEELVRHSLKAVLESFNFKVVTAADGTQALGLFAAHRDEIKLVITDERMPYMDGTALVRVLRHMSAELPMIAMSGLQSEKHARDFEAQGVTRFLQKPFSTSVLAEAIREALGAESTRG